VKYPARIADPVSRERVLDVALAIVESDGVDALTMRALAAKLGVAVTAIYWHVGNRDALLAALVDRIGDEVGHVDVRGRTPAQRVLSIGRSLRRNLDAHRHLIGIAHDQGHAAVVFVGARDALTTELAAAGLRGARQREAVEAVIHLVVGSVLIDRATDRGPAQQDSPVAAGGTERVFDVALKALVAGLLDT
jgi:AcrR family transcriptional regulator